MTGRRVDPWPHRCWYASSLLWWGMGVYLSLALDDAKALGPCGAVGGLLLVLAIADHLDYWRMRRGG